MKNEAPIDRQPLVTIIVPITKDNEDSSRRINEAHSQTWQNLEVIHVKMDGEFTYAQAINRGLAVSKGDYISLILPKAHYSTDKIARQVAFVEQFELQDAAVFCDYTVLPVGQGNGIEVRLPYIDPSAMFRRIYCGLPVDSNTLLVSRKAIADFRMPDGYGGKAALQGFVLALSQHTDLVGMAASLVSIEELSPLNSAEKAHLRNLYIRYLPEIVRQIQLSVHDSDLYSILGDATAARLVQGLPLAAWDAFSTACKLISESGNTRRSMQSFCKPLLRKASRPLPASAKNFLRNTLINQTAEADSRLDFSVIYRENGFVGTESVSGPGSTRFQTRYIRQKLPELFRELGVKSVLDIPCGDFHWMKDVDLGDVQYIGADLVDDMVHKNRMQFDSNLRKFESINLITGPLPDADLVFCRDCLVHLTNEDALFALETVKKSNCQWFLTTTFTRDTPNVDLNSLGWRPLNLTMPPFNLPQPRVLISEKCTEAGGLAGDKSLGLWRIADIQEAYSKMN